MGHAEGFWRDAHTTAGFLLAYEMSMRDRASQGLGDLTTKAKKTLDMANDSPEMSVRETLRKMSQKEKQSLDDLIEEAITEHSGCNNKRMLGVFDMEDGRLVLELHNRMHKSGSFKTLMQNEYYSEICNEIESELRSIGCVATHTNIMRMGHALMTQGSLSK